MDREADTHRLKQTLTDSTDSEWPGIEAVQRETGRTRNTAYR